MTIKSSISQNAQEDILKGAKIMSDVVSSSLGPKGRNVAIAYRNEYKIWGRVILHDGVSIAKAIELKNEFENTGAQFVRDAAARTVDQVGDGTTVSTLLAYSIFAEIYKLQAAGYNPMALRKGIEEAVSKVTEEIKKHVIPVKTIEQKKQIASISAADPELGELIANVFEKMGHEGLVIPEKSKNAQTSVDMQTGFQIEKGWSDPQFMTNPNRGEAVIEQPYILIADGLVNDLEPIKDLLSDCHKNHRKLVFIAPQFGLQAAGAMIANKQSGAIPCLLIEAPSFGQNQKNVLQDIAIFTNATFFSDWTGKKIDDVTIKDLGRCEFIKSTKNDTLIVGSTASKEILDNRIAELKKSIEIEDIEFDQEKLKERLARLTSGVAVIRVGGQTEVEMNERMERVKDAVAATRAAIRSGIVAGGEVIYLVARQKLNRKDITENLIYNALYEPFKTLLQNAALNDGEWYEKLKNSKKNMGVDVMKEELVDMIAKGIIDPSEVPIRALANAASIAVALSSTGYIIVQEDIDKK